MALLKQVKKLIIQNINKFKNSFIYKFSRQSIKLKDLQKELENNKCKNLIKERKYIDELNIQKYEIRYINLQMTKIIKYINSSEFNNDEKKYIKEHLLKLIEGNKYE